MQCFAGWYEDPDSGLQFRDQTILQFGDQWDRLANFVLCNPGSAKRICDEDGTAFLKAMGLPFFVETEGNEGYYRFSIDPLMRNLARLLARHYSGGVIKIYNLVNIKSPQPNKALRQVNASDTPGRAFTVSHEILYCDAPVVIAAGQNGQRNQTIQNEMRKYTGFARPEQLYALRKLGARQFSFVKTGDERGGWVRSYHPSYTFHYGNETFLGQLAAR